MSLQAYAEAKGRIQKGDKVWQIAFGSSFKCNSSAWRALTAVIPIGEKNPWTDEINDFPIKHDRGKLKMLIGIIGLTEKISSCTIMHNLEEDQVWHDAKIY
ncbi:hypothetical protein POM88_000155 [Heracleum sosnowskyi]|uniref:Beta-ketoacyl-[acyl-carrier-protein] synthase III C-terminal domain-containing protein n=1 Tax=Heracleum sosnowskyi TaxID=360622 RepID=A0AAD8J9S8_9APIA|nr:hypothetical protein POM88_000155 [Heracleum sosnowskyi]